MSNKVIKNIDKVVDKVSKKTAPKNTGKKAKPVQRTKADIERERNPDKAPQKFLPPTDAMAEAANNLHFLEGKTKPKTVGGKVVPPKKTYYWVLEDKHGNGIARSYESKSRRIEAIRDAIEALGKGIWTHQHHIPSDNDYDRVVDEGVRLGLIEEI